MIEEARQAKAVEKQAQNELKNAGTKPSELSMRLESTSTGPKQMPKCRRQSQEQSDDVEVVGGVEIIISRTSRGREVRKSNHFGE